MDCWLNLSNNPAKNMSLGDPHPMRGLLQSTGSSVPSSSSSSDASNGRSSVDFHREPSTGHDAQEPDTKAFKVQQNPKEGYNLKDNLALLDESIADLNRSTCSENLCFRTPDTFTFKMEEFSSLDKPDYDFGSYGQTDKDESESERLIEENALDILQSLELPGSLSDLSEFCVTNDDAFFPSLAVEDTPLGDSSMMKDTTPVLPGKNMNGNDEAHPQQTLNISNLNAPAIKMEKDADFIQLCTPGVIKQENERSSYCQRATMPGHPGASVSMDSQSYHYGVSTPLPDQKPVLDLCGPLPAGSDGWIQGGGLGNASEMHRADRSVSQPCPAYAYNR